MIFRAQESPYRLGKHSSVPSRPPRDMRLRDQVGVENLVAKSGGGGKNTAKFYDQKSATTSRPPDPDAGPLMAAAEPQASRRSRGDAGMLAKAVR